MEIGLSLGSNLGDRLQNLIEAKKRVAAVPGVALAAISPVYETEPVDVAAEFSHLAFLNAILIVESAVALRTLARRLRAIEDEMGRVRGPDRNSPRPIDIDVIFADGIRLSAGGLTIPHPRWAQRRFVAQPLADVRPDLKLPGESRTVREVAESLPPDGKVTRYAERW